MMVVGLDHVQLAMPAGREFDARRFYAGVLGMTEVEKPPALTVRGGCWFESPGTVVHLGVMDPFVPSTKGHPALRVTDVLAAWQVLQAAGAPVEADSTLPDVRRFYTADPFGNRIEIIQDGDGFAQRSEIAGQATPTVLSMETDLNQTGAS